MTFSTDFTRRGVLCGAAAALTILAPGGAARTTQPSIARGRVRTADGAGVPGVMVTNGRDVVTTGGDGQYELSVNRDCIISVVKPSGYAIALDPDTKLPRHYYVHRPTGSPAHIPFAYPGVAATGPLPSSIDFTLTKRDEPTAFNVILFADPQPETDAEVDFIRDGVIPAAAGVDAAFGVTLGDIVGDDLSLYGRINGLIGTLEKPWYNVCGNHDLNYESPDNSFARETFIRTFGPSHYAFEHGEAMFIMLDNVVYEGADPTEPGQMGRYHDGISDEQLDFVANVLARTPPSRLIVLGMHIPLRSRRDHSGREIATDDCARLLDIIGDRPAVSFAGHTHMAEHRYIWRTGAGAPHHHQVLTTVCGSWWSGPFDRRGVAIADACDGAPSGFYVLSVNGNSCRTTFRPTNEPAARQVRAVLCERPEAEYAGKVTPKLRRATLRAHEAQTTEIVANVFDGGPRTLVFCSVDHGPEIAMRREDRTDPFVAAVYANNREAIKPWVKAERSTHVWAAPLPGDLTPGAHAISIRATDEFGRTHRETLAFEIQSSDRMIAGRG